MQGYIYALIRSKIEPLTAFRSEKRWLATWVLNVCQERLIYGLDLQHPRRAQPRGVVASAGASFAPKYELCQAQILGAFHATLMTP